MTRTPSFLPEDHDLPSLVAIVASRNPEKMSESVNVRRSPRKHNISSFDSNIHHDHVKLVNKTLTATSMQRKVGSIEPQHSKRSALGSVRQPQTAMATPGTIMSLSEEDARLFEKGSRSSRPLPGLGGSLRLPHVDSLLLPISKMTVKKDSTDTESDHSSRQSRNLAVRANSTKTTKQRSKPTRSRFILGEARCNEDLADSDADNDGEEEDDTDLSGFIVDDAAELSYHESMESEDSEHERRQRNKEPKKPRRRLQRGRRKMVESEDDKPKEHNSDSDGLASVFRDLTLTGTREEHHIDQDAEVIDLTSSPSSTEHRIDLVVEPEERGPAKGNFLDKFKAPKLSPPRQDLRMVAPTRYLEDSEREVDERRPRKSKNKAISRPTTPPRSPTKLKSPSKQLLSPSKRSDAPMRSPHRPSLDAFWDHNVINEFNDQLSPRKAPMTSPRKLFERFQTWSESEDEDKDVMSKTDDSSDSLPSPCESPTKRASSPIKNITKAEKQRLQEQKKAEHERKVAFAACKDNIANELLQALDENVTNSKISAMTASTGGVRIVWSKTLRSTAGRAQWRRTVTKPTGSPVKGSSLEDERIPGNTVSHFATIELATKIIDRPERLISTLTHEFCHLANYMISNIRDQPHGSSFHRWGQRCTKYLKSESGRPEWKDAEVATKHNYDIDFKYVWVCAGRDQNMAMRFLELEQEGGCGAEYGRHSKSVDTEKHRCGRCKGKLVQVRPKPRVVSPKKKKEEGVAVRTKVEVVETRALVKRDAKKAVSNVEIIELSD